MILLGIDLGTTGVKAIAIDPYGKVLASTTEEYPLYHPFPGWAEQDPFDWWKATVKAIRNIGTFDGISLSDVVGIGLSGQMHGLVLLDEKFALLRPAILWCDLRTTRECEQYTQLIGEEKLLQIFANPALEGFTAPKLLWVKNNEKEVFKRTKHLLLPKDYVRFLLTGELMMEISDASGTLLLNVSEAKWAEEAQEAIGFDPNILPPLVGSAEIAGRITKEVAQKTGLKPCTIVVGGGADNTCSAVGIGIVKEGLVSSSIGTSGVVFAHSEKLRLDRLGRVHSFNHSVPGKYYLMGVMQAAGFSLQWFRDQLRQIAAQQIDYTDMEKFARNAPPGSDQVIFLPYLHGERTPHRDANARGVFFGFGGEHNISHLFRSIYEGITFGLKDSLSIIEELGIQIEEIRAIGGGAKSDFWLQMQADIFEHPITVTNVSEGPAYGAAILAGVGAEIYPSIEDACNSLISIRDVKTPNPDHQEKYRSSYRIYRQLYPKLKDIFKLRRELL